MKQRHLLVLLFGLALQVWSGTAHAVDYHHKICVKLHTGFMDETPGDYGSSADWFGRGIKISAYNFKGYASKSNGCVSFTTNSKSTAIVTVYAESRLGNTNNILVRSFPDNTAYTTWNADPTNDTKLTRWIKVIAPTCVGTECTIDITNTDDDDDAASNMHVAAVWAVHNIDSDTPSHITGNRIMNVVNTNCSPGVPGTGSCGSDPLLKIQPENDGARRKFLIGHEAGHWFHDVWKTGALSGGSYAVQNPRGTTCDSTGIPGDHALRSLEFQGAAFIEGFAHYLSTLAFNDVADHAEFQYYKADGPNYDNDLIDIYANQVVSPNWYQNGCGCGTPLGCAVTVDGVSVPADHMAVEVDWLRMFWMFRANTAMPKPDHNDIFDLVADAAGGGSYSTTATYDQLTDAVPAAFLDRWELAAAVNGVNH